MRPPLVKTCCCGCTNRAGSIIISILGILVGVALAALNVVEVSWIGISVVGLIRVANAVVLLVQSILLLYGASKRSRLFLLPHLLHSTLIMAYILTVIPLAVILFFACPSVLFEAMGSERLADFGVGIVAGFVVVHLIFLALLMYLWIVVYSFFLELKAGEETRNASASVAFQATLGKEQVNIHPPSYKEQDKRAKE